jgi:alkylation response protein AidB-like acyl-CoA dehydrogenase
MTDRELIHVPLGDDYPDIREGVRAICAKYPGKYWRDLEDDDAYAEEFVSELSAAGYLGALIPEDYGGAGLPIRAGGVILEEIHASGCNAGACHAQMYTMGTVLKHGSAAQKQRFLPDIAAGRLRLQAFAVTEPTTGSDTTQLRTRAVRDGDTYVVNGTKTWISNGIHGHAFALLVKTDPTAEPRHRGMSMLIAEKGPGFTVSRKLEKIGYKGIDSAELVFQDYVVPASALIGGTEGRGMQTALGGLELGRINIAARGCGIAKAALDESVRYAQLRKTFGKPIAEHQAIALKLAEMAMRTEAAIALTYNAARAYDAGQRVDMEAGMAKYTASEAALANATDAMRIHGAYGYSKEFNIERYYRDAPLLCIGEGTNEMQKIIIARQLVERNRV